MTNPISAAETIHNLNLLGDQLKTDLRQNIQVLNMDDYKSFFSIFTQDFENIASAKASGQITLTDHDWSKLEASYQETLELINAVAIKYLKDVDIPLITDPVPPSEFTARMAFAKENTHIKTNIEMLENCDILKVKGDGHCLFRSLGAAIASSPETTAHFKKTFSSLIMKKDAPPLNKEEIKACKELSIDTLKTHPTSNHLVSALRKLACYYNSKDVEFQNFLTEPTADYLRKMTDMDLAEYGGEEESLALANLLEIQIHVINVTTKEISEKTHGSDSDQNLYLLFSPGHYDVLVPKRR